MQGRDVSRPAPASIRQKNSHNNRQPLPNLHKAAHSHIGNEAFPNWEQAFPNLGTRHSHIGNKNIPLKNARHLQRTSRRRRVSRRNYLLNNDVRHVASYPKAV